MKSGGMCLFDPSLGIDPRGGETGGSASGRGRSLGHPHDLGGFIGREAGARSTQLAPFRGYDKIIGATPPARLKTAFGPLHRNYARDARAGLIAYSRCSRDAPRLI